MDTKTAKAVAEELSAEHRSRFGDFTPTTSAGKDAVASLSDQQRALLSVINEEATRLMESRSPALSSIKVTAPSTKTPKFNYPWEQSK